LLDIAEHLNDTWAGLRSLGRVMGDTTSPAGRMVLTVFAGMAGFEQAPPLLEPLLSAAVIAVAKLLTGASIEPGMGLVEMLLHGHQSSPRRAGADRITLGRYLVDLYRELGDLHPGCLDLRLDHPELVHGLCHDVFPRRDLTPRGAQNNIGPPGSQHHQVDAAGNILSPFEAHRANDAEALQKQGAS
jgi:hypothetical protein